MRGSNSLWTGSIPTYLLDDVLTRATPELVSRLEMLPGAPENTGEK